MSLDVTVIPLRYSHVNPDPYTCVLFFKMAHVSSERDQNNCCAVFTERNKVKERKISPMDFYFNLHVDVD